MRMDCACDVIAISKRSYHVVSQNDKYDVEDEEPRESPKVYEDVELEVFLEKG